MRERSEVCSLEDIEFGGMLRAVNDGRLYRKCGDRRIEPVRVVLFSAELTRNGRSITWTLPRTLRCVPVSQGDLRKIRVRKAARCVATVAVVLLALGCWMCS
jgi:hypothetical protein